MSFRKPLVAALVALVLAVTSALALGTARADEPTPVEESVTLAADWIKQQWDDGSYSRTDIGLVADGIIALASADVHHGTIDEMLHVMRTGGPGYVTTQTGALAKVIMAADIGGIEDPAHFFGEDRDLVQELLDAVAAKSKIFSWGSYLSLIALTRLDVEIPPEDFTYLMDQMFQSETHGGFGWSADPRSGDPDYTGLGITALNLVAERTDDATIRSEAERRLGLGIDWTQDRANQRVDASGNHYWATYSSANSTGMVAGALAEAGVNIESPQAYLMAQQALTTSGAAWSNVPDGTVDDVRATTQAIFALTGKSYGHAQRSTTAEPTPGPAPSTPTPVPAKSRDGWCKADEGLSVVVHWGYGGAEVPGSPTVTQKGNQDYIVRCVTLTSDVTPDGGLTWPLELAGIEHTSISGGSLIATVNGVGYPADLDNDWWFLSVSSGVGQWQSEYAPVWSEHDFVSYTLQGDLTGPPPVLPRYSDSGTQSPKPPTPSSKPTKPTASPKPPTKPSPTPTPTETPFDLYTTPGYHDVNGRRWFTKCEPYSTTERCETVIWGTAVTFDGTKFTSTNKWVFNNLTYKPSPRSIWATNPLGKHNAPAGWTAKDGRRWYTECDTTTTGRNGCRSYIWATYYGNVAGTGEPIRLGQIDGWVFNNMVRFS
ncbi:hypothetical protein GCM10028820_24960 [Tessaracoccus terricola]